MKTVEVMDEIWKRLINVFGDTRLLLQHKFAQYRSNDKISKYKEPEKITAALSKLINVIKV